MTTCLVVRGRTLLFPPTLPVADLLVVDEVTLTSPDPETYPLPDPRYLAFHAAVAKVVHIAGIDEHLYAILEKYEDIRVLSDDFGVEYLDGLLRKAQSIVATH